MTGNPAGDLMEFEIENLAILPIECKRRSADGHTLGPADFVVKIRILFYY
jgi:hypothetical protein